MYATDFEYDGQRLSDYRCMICDFEDKSGTSFVNTNSPISFNKISKDYGKKFILGSSQFDECLTATFDICKDPDKNTNMYFTHEECRDIVRWLNRHEFLPFRIIYNGEYDGFYFFNASFNLEKIKIAEKICGLRLIMETDSPYAYGSIYEKIINIIDENATSQKYIITNVSDEIGELCPYIKLELYSDGDLEIKNETLNEATIIKNCVCGEVIVIDGDTLQVSSSLERNIYDSFNFLFPKLNRTISNQSNIFSFSLPCKIYLSYYPIIKDTF